MIPNRVTSPMHAFGLKTKFLKKIQRLLLLRKPACLRDFPCLINIRSHTNQYLSSVDVTSICCPEQRRPSVFIFHSDLCASLDEYSGDISMSLVGCFGKRCIPVPISYFKVDAS